MNYSELEDKAVRKIARIQTEIDAGNEFIMTGNRDVNRRGFIDFFTSKNHVDAPGLKTEKYVGYSVGYKNQRY